MASTADPKSDKLKQVYGDRSVAAQRKIYREWADTYDSQTTNEFGWMGFKPAAEAFSERVPNKSARILDAGCGTGLSGKALADLGYSNLHGRDLSPEMLEVARKRQIYASTGEMDMTSPLEEELFEAVISVGVFGFGPPFPEHIIHLVNCTQQNGLVVLTVNGKGWIDRGWSQVLPKIVEEQGLNLEEELEIPYLEKEQINGKLLVFRA